MLRKLFVHFKTAALLAVIALYATPALSARHAYSSNSAPTISGTPPTTATVNVAYKFQPTATDQNGDRIWFSIRNKPTWATFSSSTGLLSGTPTTAGQHSDIVISASDGRKKSSLAAFTITVANATNATNATTVTNRAPTISGTPATSVQAGSAYSFTPTATDADGDTLGFSISNRPSWATFSTANGSLNGTPTAAYTHSNIVISVSDGRTSVSLPAFSISVSAASTPTTGNATLTWAAPTTNTDGSALTDLSGYKIYYGSSPSTLSSVVSVSVGSSSYVVTNLSAGTWYFAMTSLNTAGNESAQSTVVSKTL